MTVTRTLKLSRRRMLSAHIPELDYPYMAGSLAFAVLNVLGWFLLLRTRWL